MGGLCEAFSEEGETELELVQTCASRATSLSYWEARAEKLSSLSWLYGEEAEKSLKVPAPSPCALQEGTSPVFAPAPVKTVAAFHIIRTTSASHQAWQPSLTESTFI